MKRAGVTKPLNPIGIGHCGPTLVARERGAAAPLPLADAHRRGALVPALQRTGLGLRLANLATRADRDGDVYIVNGQKTWTSLAQNAKFGS